MMCLENASRASHFEERKPHFGESGGASRQGLLGAYVQLAENACFLQTQ